MTPRGPLAPAPAAGPLRRLRSAHITVGSLAAVTLALSGCGSGRDSPYSIDLPESEQAWDSSSYPQPVTVVAGGGDTTTPVQTPVEAPRCVAVDTLLVVEPEYCDDI